ncbi:MAG: putative glycoside hydrolase, partial [Dehalococcoidia bacterium]|nr:putative glycoside hydrolase [Dehalococcoidia bacterium]
MDARGRAPGRFCLRAWRRWGAALAILSALILLPVMAFASSPDEYVVQPGDTLWAIAETTGTTVEALVTANRISDPSFIRVGQKLALSGDGSDLIGPDPGASAEPGQGPRAPRIPHQPIRGIYMTYFSAASQEYRDHVFDLLENTSLNAVVIDVKGDRGYVAFPTQVELAQEIGAQDYLTMRDIADLMASFKARHVYTIARIVAFKDDPLASARPDLAVHNRRTGGLWTDNEGLAWTDPFQPEVWDYNIAIAVEASRKGFDEIQFDYVRFPTDGDVDGAVFSQPSTQETRQSAIQGFLAKARQALKPMGVKLGIDTFGYTAWRDDDMGIG